MVNSQPERHRLPQTTPKPWGKEVLYAFHQDKYAAKLLYIQSGHQTSKQYHDQKVETLLVVAGQCRVSLGPPDDLTIILNPWNFIHITPKRVHRIQAVTDCTIIEVSTTQLDDVIRLADDYGRIPLAENGLLEP